MDEKMVSRGLTFLLTVVGLGIFYTVLMTKLDVMAQQTQANIKKYSAELAWENYLYDQAILKAVNQKSSQSSAAELIETQEVTDQ